MSTLVVYSGAFGARLALSNIPENLIAAPRESRVVTPDAIIANSSMLRDKYIECVFLFIN